MTGRTKYFLIGGVLVLVAGLAVGLVAFYAGGPGLFSRGASGPAELRYVPANASAVAYANVHEIMTSNFRQRILHVAPNEQGRREFEQRTGIDVEKDIDHVVACFAPAAGADGPGGLVLARGHFDQQKIDGLLDGQGARTESYGGVSLRVHQEDGHDGPQHAVAVAFLEPDLAAIGSEALVKSAIDLRAGRGTNVLSNADLMGLIRGESRGDSAWAVGSYDALAAHARLPEQVTSRIPPITWFAVGGHVNDGVSGTLKAETRDDQAAQNLRQVVQGLIALARMQVASQPDLNNLLQSVQLSGSGKMVSVSFSVPAALLDRLPAMEHGARHGAGEPR